MYFCEFSSKILVYLNLKMNGRCKLLTRFIQISHGTHFSRNGPCYCLAAEFVPRLRRGQECDPSLCELGCHVKDSQPLPGTTTGVKWQKDGAIFLFRTEAPDRIKQREMSVCRNDPH